MTESNAYQVDYTRDGKTNWKSIPISLDLTYAVIRWIGEHDKTLLY